MEIDFKVFGEVREIGFGGNLEVKEENKNDLIRCVVVVMGYLLRIWYVKFGEYILRLNGFINVYLFGEDIIR